MLTYIVKRLLITIPTLIVISIISFVLIQLPPGDLVDSIVNDMRAEGEYVEPRVEEAMRSTYNLDRPFIEQYWIWLRNAVHGNFGYSFVHQKAVEEIIWERLGMTLIITTSSLLFTWAVAFPIGFYSAVNQYKFWDYFFTFLGFIGKATPNFLMALILLYVAFRYFGQSVGGLFSPEFYDAPWSWLKFVDLLKHLWIPMVIVGASSTAGLIRVLRNNLLDELQKPYVQAARARGMSEFRLLLKYPVRVAINPFISTVGWILPELISGSTIVAIVLSLPTTGPVLLNALLNQDMYLAGSFTMLLAMLTVIGTLISDILLSIVDPRIRYE
jgi:peptide/nickel transport system permease protein